MSGKIDLDQEIQNKFDEIFGERRQNNDEEKRLYPNRVAVEDYIKKNTLTDEQKEALLSMPWESRASSDVSFEEAECILNESHYGMNIVKEKVLELLAVQKRVGQFGKVLLLVGPPGIGKTTIVQSIARALKRPLYKKALAGIVAGWEITGSNPQWKNSSYGLAVEAIQRTKSFSPIVLLDELDKIGQGGSGHSKPSSAMLSLFDSNKFEYVDDFLRYPIDISNILFIATANDLSKVDEILLDRMEVIYLNGYSYDEKKEIISKYIIPRKCKEYNLGRRKIGVDRIIDIILEVCAVEPGVRLLEKSTDEIFRAIVYEMAKNKAGFIVNSEFATNLLAKRLNQTNNKFYNTPAKIGVVNALCRYEESIYPVTIEVVAYSGYGNYTVSGVKEYDSDMIETAKVALICCTEQVKKIDLSRINFHIRFNCEKAIKIEGVGLAVLTAMVSALSEIEVSKEYIVCGNTSPSGYCDDVEYITAFIQKTRAIGNKKIIIPMITRTSDFGFKDESILRANCISDVLGFVLDAKCKGEKTKIGFG